MKSNKASSENSFVRSVNKSLRKRKIIAGVGVAAVLAVVGAGIGVGLGIRNSNRIAKAKTVISQVDINTTFKEPDFPDDEDWDKDGVINVKETRNKTNLQSEDTDGDGLTDGDEKKLGTNPLKSDTDNDGLLDGYEIMAGLNPRMTATDGKTKDGDRVVTVTKKAGDAELTLTGNANIADTSIEELDLFGISSNTSIVSKAYDSYSNYEFNTAEIKFALDSAKISKMGYSKKDLTILKFDSTNQSYTKIDSTLDSSENYLTANISELGTYVVGVEKTVNNEAKTRVCFLIDNSGSMYPKTQCATSTENDVNFKRIDFAESLVDKFSENYKVGICKFTGTYTKLSDFTNDHKQLKSILESIKTQGENFNGTYSTTALTKCMNEFTESSDEKYRNIIVMLTDGESDEYNPDTVQNLLQKANNKNIVVLTVGLGRDVDRQWLQELASGTGGKYYSASDANALDQVYRQIVTTLNYDIVNYNNADDNVMGYSLYNTGFDPSVNGFSFKNFRTTTTSGVDFGMAVFARDWYLGTIKTSLGKIKPADNSKLKVESDGYDLEGTDAGIAYESRIPLNDFNSAMLSGPYSDVKEYLDYNSKGEVLKVDDKYRDCVGKGWVIEKTPIDAGNLEWKYVELLNLDIEGGMKNIEGENSKSDAQLAAALYRLNALQWDDSAYEFNLTNGDSGFKELDRLLSLGEPVVTTIDDKHTVNSIGLIQDSLCHRKYVLQVYDNNYPGKTKEIYIEKKPKCSISVDENGNAKVTGTGFTYCTSYEGKQVGLNFSKVEEY